MPRVATEFCNDSNMLCDTAFFNRQNVIYQGLAIACLQMFEITDKIDIAAGGVIGMTDNAKLHIFRVQCIQRRNQIRHMHAVR